MITDSKAPAANQKPVWFITGCSTGFGRALATYVLGLGYPTVITARNPEDIRHLCDLGEALVLELDVTNQSQIDAAVAAAERSFGRIDVLVNNAGIGYFAAIEESEDDQVRRMFDINVFGLGRMITAALPNMRKLRKGAIINLSSIAGMTSVPSLGYYSASKHAVEGLSEALRQEVEPLGIKVMVVEPSGFRTDWAGRSADGSHNQIEDYAGSAGKVRHLVRDSSGHQPGDPVRAAKAIVDAIESAQAPRHLLLGKDSFDAAMANIRTLEGNFEMWKAVSLGADFPLEPSHRSGQTDV